MQLAMSRAWPMEVHAGVLRDPGPWSASAQSQFQVLKDSCGHQARPSQDGAQCRHLPYVKPLAAASCHHSVLLLPEADGKG